MNRYVIIGNGIAGISAAETIRRTDQRGKITVVAAEPHPVYSRPGLAYYLLGQVTEERLFCHPPDFFGANRIEQLFVAARHIDWLQKSVLLENGQSLPYDKLLIATGAKNNWPSFSGIDLQGVVALATLDDANHIKQLLPLAQQAVVIGGGITAIEMVEIFRHHGLETHYLLRGSRFWPRLLAQPESELVEKRMRECGVHIHYEAEISEIIGEYGCVTGVKTNTGQLIPCQMVGVAIGIAPNTDLVDDTLIACDRGILVNEYMQTSLPHIYAAGDVAQVLDPATGRASLDLLWHSALKGGQTAGANMAGQSAVYKKGVPFNSAMLFDIPFTSIGQINPAPEQDDNIQQIHLTRGFSERWLQPTRGDAADRVLHQHQPASNETLRLVTRDNQVMGGVLLGNQTTADAIRDMVVQQTDISPIKKMLFDGKTDAPGNILVNYWRKNRAQPRNGRANGNSHGKGGG